MTEAILIGEDTGTPPRAAMAFRVGVVGHRPDRLPRDDAGLEAIRGRMADVLVGVAKAMADFAADPDARHYSDAAHTLRAVSPLAEGADRMFAEEALRLGYHLCCVMPFAQGEFEEDFRAPQSAAPDALAGFRALLDEARRGAGLTTFELDGSRDRRAEAYEAAGRVVLNQSDLLVVVWDGGGAGGVGGTLNTLRQAIAFSVPVVWIDSRAPHGCRVLRHPEDLDCLMASGECPAAPSIDHGDDQARLRRAIADLVVDELALPAEAVAERSHLGAYQREERPRVNLAFAWKLFRDLLDQGRLRLPRIRVADFVDQIADDWPVADAADPSAPRAGVAWINALLRPHYAWSDKLADRYADAHRSAFVWASLLAATAVFLALLPMAAAWRPHTRLSVATAIVEACVLIVMVGLPILARPRRWHQRWLEYRVLAELIRELRILVPVGGGRPLPRTPAHLAAYGDPTRSWMYWQIRAIARAAGLPKARVDSRYVAEHLAYLGEFVGAPVEGHAKPLGQIGFHHANCERMERIHHQLHRLALILFAVTIVGVALNWLVPMVAARPPAWVGRWLILVSAFFPALGAALASINNQGEFARLQRRSRAMQKGFEALKRRIVDLRDQGAGATLAEVTTLAAHMAAMMVDENIDWRIVVLDLPHAAG
ncbi:MAG: DUF4231 domain-containing protein [Pseudomonadota bacterium]|nr:DUF4231 domain-containing protein [Pseudomonadota bacterium]